MWFCGSAPTWPLKFPALPLVKPSYKHCSGQQAITKLMPMAMLWQESTQVLFWTANLTWLSSHSCPDLMPLTWAAALRSSSNNMGKQGVRTRQQAWQEAEAIACRSLHTAENCRCPASVRAPLQSAKRQSLAISLPHCHNSLQVIF